MKTITEAIISKSKITTSTLEEDIFKDLLEPKNYANKKGISISDNIFQLGDKSLIIVADNIGKEYRYSRERIELESINLSGFVEKYGIKNIIIENNTGCQLDIFPSRIVNLKGVNIINKGKTNVCIRYIESFEGGSLQGDIYLKMYEETREPFKFIKGDNIKMYYPIYVDRVVMDEMTIVALIRNIEKHIVPGRVFEYILMKNGRYEKRLYIATGITPEDFKKNYHTSEYKGNGVYHKFGEVKTRGDVVYSVTKY